MGSNGENSMNLKKALTGDYAQLVAFSLIVAIVVPSFVAGCMWIGYTLVDIATSYFGFIGGLMSTFMMMLFVLVMGVGIASIHEGKNKEKDEK